MRTATAPRLPVRWRLTALYAAVFFVAGGLIVLAMYLLVTVELENQPGLDLGDSLVFAPEPNQSLPGQGVGEVLPRVIERADESRREATLASLLRQSLLALLVVGALAAVLGHQLAGRALRPLAQITATARRVADESLHERIALRGPEDEIKELADTFDDMLGRLDDAFAGQRHFVANASHELRTPLTVERTLVEVALADPRASADLRRLGTSLLEINARSERLIEALLTLARSEHALTAREPCDLRDLTETALREIRPELEERALTVHATLGEAPLLGDVDLVGHLVSNLVRNASRHNQPGGEVWVATGVEDEEAVLRIANTGEHIAPADLARMFEPFERLGAERTGTGNGLGLSIARSVAHSHGGTVTAASRRGGGVEMVVRLPSGREAAPSGPRPS